MLLPHVRALSAVLGLAVVLAVAATGSVSAAKRDPLADLWATVNICDTKKHPDQIGIRARMPGYGDAHENMRMQFLVQVRKAGKWTLLANGFSPWDKLGSADRTWRESGWTFKINEVAAGTSYRFRGLVKFEWRKHGKVTRSATRVTSAHHRTDTGDPRRYSEGTCTISN